MRTCPVCGAEYAPGDVICPRCEAELPEPYDVIDEEEGEETAALSSMLPIPAHALILAGVEMRLEDETVRGTVVVVDGRIQQILRAVLPDPHDDGMVYLDLRGMTLSPGFIDVHVHGMMGFETNGASVEDFLRISAAAAAYGITGLVPTTLACLPDELRTVFENLRVARAQGLPGARLLGIHLESNFISMEFKGAQPAEAIFPPTDQRAWDITELLDEYQDDVCIVTLAPELPGALDLIPWLRERDIVVSLGHSAANYEQAIAGFDAGATQVTHLFNAMAPLHHRNPNLVGAALERDDVFVQIVCDGVHVHPSIISTVISAKGPERTVPISDGLRGAGLREGGFQLVDRWVTVEGGVARLENGTIAGSITTMDAIVRFLVEIVGWDVGEALSMASTTAAASLGFEALGVLRPGAIADLAVLDENLTVRMTLVNGKVVYDNLRSSV